MSVNISEVEGRAIKVGIVIDTWKLDVFVRHLTQHGYDFMHSGGKFGPVTTLTVETENVNALQTVIKAANAECARTGSLQ